MPYVLALDEGTTSCRAVIFDKSGQVRGIAQREFAQHYPQPGWVEHDADEIWNKQIEVAREVLAQQKLRGQDLAAIGITNQRETTIVWDRKSGKPIGPAIVWQDRRTASSCERLRKQGADTIIGERTGLVLDAYFSATKIAWMLDHTAQARNLAEAGRLAFGTIDSWLIWKMTKGAKHLTDVTNASRTLLFNIHTRQWDDDLLRLFNIPRSMLPDVCDSSGISAETASDLFGVSVPIGELRATNRRPSLVNCACNVARQRRPMAPVVSCYSTRRDDCLFT